MGVLYNRYYFTDNKHNNCPVYTIDCIYSEHHWVNWGQSYRQRHYHKPYSR